MCRTADHRLNVLAREWTDPCTVGVSDLVAENVTCVLCGCLITGPTDGTGLACRECGEAELDAIRHGERSPFEADADFHLWVADMEGAFGDQEVGF